jgi:hypothetical protein
MTPRTRGAVHDLIFSMILEAPDFKSPFFPEQDRESVFADLLAALDGLKRVLGGDGHEKMKQLAQTAKAHFEAAEVHEGLSCLYNMAEFVRSGKFASTGRLEPR